MLQAGVFVAAAAIWIGAIVFVYKNTQDDKKKDLENFREPIFINRQKLLCDNYPRANGSIYGEASHLMSGYPYYDKAY